MTLIIAGILGVGIIGIFFYGVAIYNGLVKLKNKVDEAWSDIDVQLKRRYDLIPNLVETVKGYADHESALFKQVTEARSKAMQAEDPQDKARAEGNLTGALKSLFAVAESYPDLKANQNFMELQNQLSQIEDHIQKSRRYYNGNVRDFNTKIEIFPNSIFASILGFKKRNYFELGSEEERKNVKVDF
ncbi:MAG: LemA family protein [Candidatus Moranbacteria bacterium]|nr:LemA family protein [Candidatus Moranbacteria bacterium]